MNRLSGLLVIFALLFAVLGLGFYTMRDPVPPQSPEGLQSARIADLEVQPCASQAPDGAFILTLGNAALWFKDFPHTVVTVGGQPQFTVDRSKDGGIAVDIRIIVGTQELGRLQGVTLRDESHGQLHLSRPSGSEIIVSTANRTPILQVDYINEHSLRVTGHLAFGGHDFLLFPDGFMLDHKSASATCLGGGKKVDFAL